MINRENLLFGDIPIFNKSIVTDNNINLVNNENLINLTTENNITTHHETILNGEFYFNVMLHVFILFTILHLFFKFYITKITTNAIAQEFKHIIHDVFDSIDIEKFKKNIDNYKNSFDNLSNLFKNKEEINKKLSVISFLKSKYNINSINDLITVISSKGSMLPPHNNSSSNSENLFSIDPNKLNEMAQLFANNFNLDYYLSIFSKPDTNREKINTIVFKNITFINVLLFVFLILVTFILVKSKILTFTEIKHVLLENCITFFFVGIVEILFFLNIASKFIPAPPSTIFTSLLSNLQSQFI